MHLCNWVYQITLRALIRIDLYIITQGTVSGKRNTNVYCDAALKVLYSKHQFIFVQKVFAGTVYIPMSFKKYKWIVL